MQAKKGPQRGHKAPREASTRHKGRPKTPRKPPRGPKTLQCRQTIGLLLIFRHRMLKMTNPPILLRFESYKFAFCRDQMLASKNEQPSNGFGTSKLRFIPTPKRFASKFLLKNGNFIKKINFPCFL